MQKLRPDKAVMLVLHEMKVNVKLNVSTFGSAVLPLFISFYHLEVTVRIKLCVLCLKL